MKENLHNLSAHPASDQTCSGDVTLHNTAKFANTFKKLNSSLLNDSRNRSEYERQADLDRTFPEIPSLGLQLPNFVFLKKSVMDTSLCGSAIFTPQIDVYPECQKLGFDPVAINQEKEVNEDLVDLAKNLLSMC